MGAEDAECGVRNAELPTSNPVTHHALRITHALCVALLFLVWPTLAASLTDDFATDPLAHGWQVHGNTNLFAWNVTAQRLDVTWDTANPHSFFALPLPQSLTTNDDFAFGFDLQLNTASGGVRANRPGAMPLSLGLLNLSRATTNNYLRGAGKGAETMEFTWFPAGFIPGFGEVEPTQSTIAFDAAGKVAASFTFPLELTTNTLHRVRVAYRAADRTVTATLTSGGEAVALELLKLPDSLGNFALDAFAVMVWNEATSFSDSLLAAGWVDNVALELPEPAIGALTLIRDSPATVEFNSQRGWRYTLEASGDFAFWSELGGSASGTGEKLQLSDFRRAFFPEQFYRVRAERE